MRDFYRLLGVSERAGADEIQRAYRRLAREHHPDRARGRDATWFHEIHRAYETLSDADRRRAYDARLAINRHPAAAAMPSGGWFADEVAIDFPSVGALLDRMRTAFFGPVDAPPLLSAEILLDADDALDGLTVPLDVPLRRTCARCGGRGEVWMEPCPSCRGAGESLVPYQVKVSLPAGVRHGARFRFSVTPPFAPATLVEVRIAVR
jgi:DnaJ-class molecular chaperone